MTIRFTAIRLSGGQQHEHITHLWWANPATGAIGVNTRQELVIWVDRAGNKAYVEDQLGHRADVGVVKPRYGAWFLRSYRDGVWTDNLLALPRQ